jgi:hypothetical protein
MCRDDASFIPDLKPIEGTSGILHRIPIGLAPHDDTDHPSGFAHWVPSSCGRENQLLRADIGLRKALNSLQRRTKFAVRR